MKIHVISIGGSVMHQLAINLQVNGHDVSGSDDEIYDPARSNLEKVNLLPQTMGWNPDRISTAIDVVILGMHAKADNPELIRAQELKLTIYSYPEFIYNYSKSKTRVVVAGSHGKTTTTSMIMHILKASNIDFDFLIGAKAEGFDSNVKLSDAKLIVLEGDEYLSSAVDRSSKFLHYRPDVAIITGIAWDHINVFPTLESYLDSFRAFIKSMDTQSSLFYFNEDILSQLVEENAKCHTQSYTAFPHRSNEIIVEDKYYGLKIFGKHNFANLRAAFLACEKVGVKLEDFIESIQDFETPDKRLNLIHESHNTLVFRDFAHAPSKVRATVEAVSRQYPDKQLKVILELHTYSSLNKSFLIQYEGSLEGSHESIVMFNPKTLEIKGLEAISIEYISSCFKQKGMKVVNHTDGLQEKIQAWADEADTVVLIMSSGHLGGIKLQDLFSEDIS